MRVTRFSRIFSTILLFIAATGSEAKFDEGNGKDSEDEDEDGEEGAIIECFSALLPHSSSVVRTQASPSHFLPLHDAAMIWCDECTQSFDL